LSIPNEITTACIDVDKVDILATLSVYGYRSADIEAYLAKKLNDLLDIQQDDGGFYDTTSGTRLFDGWSVYQEPQGLSNCFATWFRMIAIGMCAEVLYPGSFKWKFRKGVGIGYFNRDYLKDGFEEPVEPLARTYSSETTSDAMTSAASANGVSEDLTALDVKCSDELIAVIDEVRTRFGHERADFSCVFEVTGDGVFTLNMREGTVKPGNHGGDLVVTLSLKTLRGILSGKTNPTAAYALRKLKLKGDMGKALKLVGLLG